MPPIIPALFRIALFVVILPLSMFCTSLKGAAVNAERSMDEAIKKARA